MTVSYKSSLAAENSQSQVPEGQIPKGQVLRGQYIGVFRSDKGKLKGLWLRFGHQDHAVKLPKYLRPMLVSELVPEAFVQVWAYPSEGGWRAINILPLAEAEVVALRERSDSLPQTDVGPHAMPRTRFEICGKGKCCKRGSQSIWRSLQAALEANPDLKHISLAMTGCMKTCASGPNLRVCSTGQTLHHVTLETALAALSEG